MDGLFEIKRMCARIVYKQVAPNVYIIVAVIIKKRNKDRVLNNLVGERNNMLKQNPIDLNDKSVFKQAQEQYDKIFNNIKTKGHAKNE